MQTANYDFLYTIFWLALTGTVSGATVYFFMKRQATKTHRLLSDLQKSYTDLLKEMQKKEKLAQLEISARDKKLSILNAKIDELNTKA